MHKSSTIGDGHIMKFQLADTQQSYLSIFKSFRAMASLGHERMSFSGERSFV